MEEDSGQTDILAGSNAVAPAVTGTFPAVSDLLAQAEVLRHATSWGNADTYIWRDWQGRRLFVKTFATHPLWARKLLGQRTLLHEFRTLQQLQALGFTAAPKAVALLEKDTLLLELLSGQRLESRRHYQADNLPTPEFFRQLQALLQQLHSLGFCHGDFRRANIIVSDTGSPMLVDWSTAIFNRADCSCCLWRSWMHRALRNSDLLSLASIIESFYPELLTPEMQRRLEKQPWYLAMGRFLRQKVYRKMIKSRSRIRN